MRSALLLVSCAACALGGSRPHYEYYVLTSRAPSREARSPDARTIGIDRVTLPGYLDREQIATRTAGQHVAYSASDRWAEPLDRAFERTLRDDLASSLAGRGIRVLSPGSTPTYDLSIDVTRFEQAGSDHVELSAHWILKVDNNLLDNGETRLQIPMANTNGKNNASRRSI